MSSRFSCTAYLAHLPRPRGSRSFVVLLPPREVSSGLMPTEEELTVRIAAAGDAVRDLKAKKNADNAAAIKDAVAQLLALKAQFKDVTGKAFGPPPSATKKKQKKNETDNEKPKGETAEVSDGAKDPSTKSKKELNKERKKAHKLAVKTGTADASPAAASLATATSDGATAAAGVKPLKRAVYAAMELPPPSAENDGVIVFSSAGQLPRASFAVAQLVKYTPEFRNIGRDAASAALVPTLTRADGRLVSGDFAVARYLARLKPELGLYGAALKDAAATEAALVFSQIDAWLDFALTRFGSRMDDDSGLQILNRVLQTQTFIVGHALSLADIGVWALLSPLRNVLDLSVFPNVARWFAHLEAQQTVFAKIDSTLKAMKAPAPVGAVKKGKDSGSCPPLKDAVDGQVVTRFPPEPSGYLHIGHIKACMLNNYYARHYHGKLIVRFDDTNPSKEKEEFEQSILADLKRVGVEPDIVSYTSDYFPKIADFARQMIREGHAYMDNTPQEQMREERMEGTNSKCRDQAPEMNLALFEKMLKNAPEAHGCCLRGKIDMQAKNKTMRDPVFFRLNPTPHHRTGTKYLAYPTYDLACPIVDSLEGVTHALRTTEYNDRDFQYQWVLDTLRLRKVVIQSFARMNFVYSVLSKRKLQWFVDNGHVEGWTDPRFPTVQGVLRRGVQVEALRDFILSQGASRRITDMEWDKFWTLNKRVLDPTAPRYFAVAKEFSVPLTLTNVEDKVVGMPIDRHPKDPSMGIKMVRFCNKLLLERDDVANFVEGEEVTLMRHGNIIIKKVNKAADGTIASVEAENFPEGDFTKTKLKVTWLADVPDLVPLVLVEFDHLLNKAKLEEDDNFQDYLTETTRAEMHALGDHELRNIKQGQVVQLERRGYFRVDVPYISDNKPVVMFMVPDGKAKAMSTLSTKLVHRSWSSKRRACVPQYATGVPHKDGSDVCRRLVPFSCRTAHLLCRSAVPASFQLPQLQRCRAPVRRHGHSPGRFLETEERAEQQRMLRQQLSAEDVKAADRITWVGVWLNVALSGLKGAAGVAFHSSGLLADAAHSIGDLVSDCVTLVTLKYCARPPDALQPYGYGKYETIGALSVSLLLVGGSLGILIHSLDSLLVLLEPVSTSTTVADTTQVVALLDHVTVKPMDGAERLAQAGHPHAHGVGLHPAALGIAAVSVVAKEALFRTTFSIGHRVHSSVLIANAWHHRSDAVTSVVALGGIGLSLAGFPLFDPLAGIAVGTIIWKMGVEMGWQRVKELCDAKVPDPVLESIASAVGDVMNASKGEVVGVRRLRCRKVGRHVHADLTVLVDGALPVHEAVKWQQEVKRAIEHKVPPVNDIVVELATNATSAEVREKNAHATRNRHE